MLPALLMGGGAVLSGLGSLFGASNQNKIQKQNLAAQQAWQKQLLGMVQGQMQNGPNPYATQIQNFLNGMQAPTVAPQTIDLSQLGQINPAQVSAPTLGETPTIGAPGTVTPQQIDLSAFLNVPGMSAPDLGLSDLLSGPGSFDAPTVEGGQIDLSALGSSGFNTGQDALMQMLNRDYNGGMDPFLSSQLNKFMTGDTSFATSGLLDALDQKNNLMLQDQVSQLRGSAGSLGERLGSSMYDAESRLRGDFLANSNLQRQQVVRDAFESAQGRAGQALGLATGREQFFAGMPLQEAQLQLAAAQGLGQLGLGQQGQLAQLLQANAGNQLSASQANAANQLQALMQSQQLGQQAGMFNIQNQSQLDQLAAQLGLQAQQGNQNAALQQNSLLAQIFQGNQNADLQAQLQGQQLGTNVGMQNVANLMNMMQFGAGQQMQAGLANQGAQNSAAMQYQQLLANALGQNASMLNQGNQFNAQNQMALQQMMLTGLGQAAGIQQAQQQGNIGLLGLLAGQQVPQAQPSAMPGAIGDLGMMGMLLPSLFNAMGGGGSRMPQVQVPNPQLISGIGAGINGALSRMSFPAYY